MTLHSKLCMMIRGVERELGVFGERHDAVEEETAIIQI